VSVPLRGGRADHLTIARRRRRVTHLNRRTRPGRDGGGAAGHPLEFADCQPARQALGVERVRAAAGCGLAAGGRSVWRINRFAEAMNASDGCFSSSFSVLAPTLQPRSSLHRSCQAGCDVTIRPQTVPAPGPRAPLNRAALRSLVTAWAERDQIYCVELVLGAERHVLVQCSTAPRTGHADRGSDDRSNASRRLALRLPLGECTRRSGRRHRS
jgi:hypothetical protein